MSVFWSVFSFIRTKYGDILIISPYAVQMHENKGQKNSEYGHFSRSAFFYIEIWDHFVLSKERRKGKKKESKTFFKLSVFQKHATSNKSKVSQKKKTLGCENYSMRFIFFWKKTYTINLRSISVTNGQINILFKVIVGFIFFRAFFFHVVHHLILAPFFQWQFMLC